VAVKFDTGEQVINDHMHWHDAYHSEATRFPGLPWILPRTLPAAPWGGAKVDVMISELLGDSLETIRRRSPTVRAREPHALLSARVGTSARWRPPCGGGEGPHAAVFAAAAVVGSAAAPRVEIA
jgi:hypothetical protein